MGEIWDKLSVTECVGSIHLSRPVHQIQSEKKLLFVNSPIVLDQAHRQKQNLISPVSVIKSIEWSLLLPLRQIVYMA